MRKHCMMRKQFLISLVILGTCIQGFAIEHFPASQADWLIDPVEQAVEIEREGNTLRASNGLIEKSFFIGPNAGAFSFKNLATQQEFLRGVKPEAAVSVNGRHFDIGGLTGQPNLAYLMPEWLEELKADPNAFVFDGFETSAIQPHIAWKQKRHSADLPWPPKGKTLTLTFVPPTHAKELDGLSVHVHYNFYEGLPALSKWISIENQSKSAVMIDAVTTEILAVVERVSDVERTRTTKPRKTGGILEHNDLADSGDPLIHVQSDYSFCGMSHVSADQTTFWEADPGYATQVTYSREWPHLLTCRYPFGPAVELGAGETFDSFRSYELLFDSDDKERQGLAIRRLQRAAAPWATENPLMLHLRYSDSESIRRAVDQCVETGFEMVILSFGSGFNMESDDPDYITRIKADFEYAHSRSIEIGGYSLLSSRSISPDVNVIDPKTGKPGAYFGNAPCLMSQWGEDYFKKLKNFIEQTGCDLLEHDGSYPGDPCASTTHKGHNGLDDSQYKQHKRIADFYQWCRKKGVYLNVPDYYFLTGSNKTGMGYRETNWSLPREMQLIHTRQNIYDGTWSKSPSMGWMFVPLVEYHGGGAAATIEPLNEHLDTYEALLASNLLSGVQACYRGPRIYDTEETKNVVIKWVDFYKKHRAILDSDIIHLRRADGRDYDGMMHVNPTLVSKGFSVFFNPTGQEIRRTVSLPLYYTGIDQKALVIENGAAKKEYPLDRHYNIKLDITIPANGWTWHLIQNAEQLQDAGKLQDAR